jgi:hypothetical protein
LVCLRPGSSSIKSVHVVLVVLWLSWDLLIADFAHCGCAFALALSLSCGGHLIHLLDHHGLLILLGDNGLELWSQCGLEEVLLKEV